MTDTTARKSIQERLRDAAVEQAQERAAERRRVEEIVFGSRSFDSSERIGDIVKLGDDYVVEVERTGHDTTWTTVVAGKRSSWHHHTQEAAVLHLIARRYDDNPNSNAQAAFYAGRVLGIPQSA
jgi:hypothetical protein